ncbi:PR-1-like protein [Paraphaeosphaeria sporulosa]|uniref:PR-1-like protein n=1 Tax=Paraphaeosphaeria sporulosa TaxID=1460663 RepID=A0A177CP84_9PLEO|nr:PR-1-like protein [Paraphaeosphaeria sporulosa]OAG09333.1 PR-1-like protein [Paraphaeosphaeria sporulosa]
MKLFALVTALAAAALAAPNHALAARDARDSSEIPGIEDQKFISTVLNAHWYWRRIHCAQDLQWNVTLAAMAQKDIRTCTKDVEHMRAGSNLSGQGPSPKKYDEWVEWARVMVHGWHEEETFWDYSARMAKGKHQVYHFTQLVWRDSSQLGCALTDCSDVEGARFPGRIYCYYDPIGNNIAGNFMQENVWPPVCADPSKAELEARFGF